MIESKKNDELPEKVLDHVECISYKYTKTNADIYTRMHILQYTNTNADTYTFSSKMLTQKNVDENLLNC